MSILLRGAKFAKKKFTPRNLRNSQHFLYFLVKLTKGRDQNNKNVSIRALPEFGGGGLPLPDFFATFFLLSKSLVNGHESSRRRKKSVKLPELGGGGA